MDGATRIGSRNFGGWVSLAVMVTAIAASHSFGQDNPEKKTPVGQFLTVTSPVDDSVYHRVSTAALKLQSQASQEDRPAVLVLQIEPGTSQFHHVQGLAKFLTSAQVSNVTTVAWIPSTITGPNVLLALACKQIVMHPDAEIGDIGRGKPLDAEEQQAVLALAQKRHNIKVNSAIVRGMMDPQETLWRVRVRSNDPGKDELESRVVTKSELDTLRGTNITIENVETIKDAGSLGTFRGGTARALDFLVSQTADNRMEVATHFGLERESLREVATTKENLRVRLIKLDGVIDTLQESFILRQIDRAVAEGAQCIVFQIDSPGGLLRESEQLASAIADLEAKNIRTIAYIEKEAISGAAIIALGCDEIYLLPNARIGDAGPIQIRSGQQFERAPEKILSPLKMTLRTLAERKHRPVALCEAMADRTMKVYQVTHQTQGRVWYMSELEIHAANGEWIQGIQLHETNGELLFTASGVRAHELKIAEAPVTDFDDFKNRIGVAPGVKLVPIAKTWVDRVVFALNGEFVRVLLIVFGVAFLYVELHFLTGILGILSALCFSLFFWSTVMGGTAGWLEVMLFVLGLACLGLEIFVIPGFGVFGVSGILLILASLVMAGHTWSLDSAANMQDLTWQMGQVLLSLVMVAAVCGSLARFLPSMPGFESLVLGPPGVAGNEPRLRVDPMFESQVAPDLAVGEQGATLTILRPAGKARFDHKVVDVVSEGGFISAETPVEIVSISGRRIVVREV